VRFRLKGRAASTGALEARANTSLEQIFAVCALGVVFGQQIRGSTSARLMPEIMHGPTGARAAKSGGSGLPKKFGAGGRARRLPRHETQ
jgi:hypothetical protein